MQSWILPFLAVVGMSIGAIYYIVYSRRKEGLRVLLYHKVDTTIQNMMTVTVAQLESHIKYLIATGYTIISIETLFSHETLPSKSVILTFDDAYLNNLELAYPILQKYQAYATIFVPTAYVGDLSRWDIDAAPIMGVEELKSLDKNLITLALHTHQHQHFGSLSIPDIKADLEENIKFFVENNLPFIPVLAYPYGGRPKDTSSKKQMFSIFEQLGIKMAFRIGNRINTLPLTNQYEIERIDIRGTDNLEDFISKVKWGKFL